MGGIRGGGGEEEEEEEEEGEESYYPGGVSLHMRCLSAGSAILVVSFVEGIS